MNKALLIVLLFLQIGMANAAIEVIGADATWQNDLFSGPNPTVSDRIVVYDANTLSRFDITAIPSDLSYRVNNIRDRIIIYDANTIYKSNLVNITTVSGIIVTSPNGGEILVRGIAKTITWNSTGNPGPNVKIELLKNGIPVGTVTSSTPNDGVYSWTVSSTRALGLDYKIKVSSTSNPTIADTSNNNFIIGGINVNIPNGGENWARGTPHTITWNYLGNPGPNVRIDLLKAGIVVGTIASNTPNDGSQGWTISTGRATGTDYKIRVTSISNSAYKDTSNNNFRIS